MYDLIPFFFGGIIFILGLVMVINPKGSTKKEFQNDENKIAATKKNGFIVVACSVILLIIGIIRFISK